MGKIKIYYTHSKVKELTDILKLRYLVKSIQNGDILHTFLSESEKKKIEKHGLKTYGDNIYDSTVCDEKYVLDRLLDFPDQDLMYYSRCLISCDEKYNTEIVFS